MASIDQRIQLLVIRPNASLLSLFLSPPSSSANLETFTFRSHRYSTNCFPSNLGRTSDLSWRRSETSELRKRTLFSDFSELSPALISSRDLSDIFSGILLSFSWLRAFYLLSPSYETPLIVELPFVPLPFSNHHFNRRQTRLSSRWTCLSRDLRPYPSIRLERCFAGSAEDLHVRPVSEASPRCRRRS